MDIATLAQRIKDEAFLEGDFILRSGKRSKYYLDKYLFSAQPDILAELGKRFAEFAGDADVIAGPENAFQTTAHPNHFAGCRIAQGQRLIEARHDGGIGCAQAIGFGLG